MKIERHHLNPVEAVGYGASQTWSVLSMTVTYLGKVITGKIPADQIGSLLGIGNTAGKVAQAGAEGAPNVAWGLLGAVVALLSLAAYLSISVGFMNLLPLPVLDGGHLVFYAYEAVARRPLPVRIQAVSYRLGLALLVGFMLFATWNDLQRLRVFNFLGGLFS
jgi:regulator of sigma E protease